MERCYSKQSTCCQSFLHRFREAFNITNLKEVASLLHQFHILVRHPCLISTGKSEKPSVSHPLKLLQGTAEARSLKLSKKLFETCRARTICFPMASASTVTVQRTSLVEGLIRTPYPWMGVSAWSMPGCMLSLAEFSLKPFASSTISS